jgi:hypothetical protein
MTRSPSKLFLALAVGAGAFSLGTCAALAGDKIAFSWSSSEKTSAIPVIVKPDDHADELALNHSSMAPVADLDFAPQSTTITILPRNRTKSKNGLDSKSDSFRDDRRMEDPWANADDQAGDNSDASNDSATNQLRIGMPKDWTRTSQRSDDLGLGYGADDSGNSSSDAYLRDQKADETMSKNLEKQKSLTVELESSRGLGPTRESVMDILRGQSQYSTEVELYRHGQSSDLPQSYGPADQTPMSSTSPLRADYRSSESMFSQGSSYVPDSYTHQSFGSQSPATAYNPWEAPSSANPGSQYNPTPAYVPPPPVQTYQPAHPAAGIGLPTPRNPNSFY